MRVETWFERDRAMVAVYGPNDEDVATWWDEDVSSLVEDGFLDPRDWSGSAIAYVRHLGIA